MKDYKLLERCIYQSTTGAKRFQVHVTRRIPGGGQKGLYKAFKSLRAARAALAAYEREHPHGKRGVPPQYANDVEAQAAYRARIKEVRDARAKAGLCVDCARQHTSKRCVLGKWVPYLTCDACRKTNREIAAIKQRNMGEPPMLPTH